MATKNRTKRVDHVFAALAVIGRENDKLAALVDDAMLPPSLRAFDAVRIELCNELERNARLRRKLEACAA